MDDTYWKMEFLKENVKICKYRGLQNVKVCKAYNFVKKKEVRV